jgi:hypothetical protein
VRERLEAAVMQRLATGDPVVAALVAALARDPRPPFRAAGDRLAPR